MIILVITNSKHNPQDQMSGFFTMELLMVIWKMVILIPHKELSMLLFEKNKSTNEILQRLCHF